MIVKTSEFQKICSILMNGVSSTKGENLELKTNKDTQELILNINSDDYYLSVKFALDQYEDFHACVKALLFLKLISSINSETIELSTTSSNVLVKTNGSSYRIPIIYENDSIMELPKIVINNELTTMTIDGNNLNSILVYNTKEIDKAKFQLKPIQTMYYLDNQGCLTFTTGACVNNFTLPQPVKVLLNSSIVPLFKLFKNSEVNFTLGCDSISETLSQTKVCFENSQIKLTAITGCNETLLNSMPVDSIRGLANKIYPYSIVIDRNNLKEALDRLLLFVSKTKLGENYGTFKISNNVLTITEVDTSNFEKLKVENDASTYNYEFTISLGDLKALLDTCNTTHVTLNFGDDRALVLTHANIKNVIPVAVKRI